MMKAMVAAWLGFAAVTVAQVRPSPADEVDPNRLMATIRALPAKRSPVGSREHQDGLRATEAMLVEHLKTLGLEPWRHEFAWPSPAAGLDDQDEPPASVVWNNIIVDLPGTDLKHEVLLISAHHDAVPMSPGADDDGTGVAAILELARVLKDRPMRRTIRLALFNLEEPGLVGSTAYVKTLREQGAVGAAPALGAADVKPEALPEGTPPADRETIIGMASLEMLGYFSDEPNSQRSPIPPQPGVFEPPTVGDSICIVGLARDKAFIRQLAEGMRAGAPGLKVTVVDFLPVAIPDMTRSDHRPFMFSRVAAVMITDTANFRNPHYHKATDTIETIDERRYTLVVRGIAGAAASIAGAAPDRPHPPVE